MKTIVLSLVSFLLFANTYAQINFQKHIIDSEYPESRSYIPADVDGDDIMDILVRDNDNETVFLFKNDGAGNFIAHPTLINSFIGSIHPVDFDGDGDIDIIWSTPNNEVAFSENIDGLGNFAIEQILVNFSEAFSMGMPSDIDGDGDNDLVCSFQSSKNLAWIENIDGLGNFGNQQIIHTYNSDYSVRQPYLTHINSDGSFDIVVQIVDPGSWLPFTWISLYQNTTGLGDFELVSQIISGPYGKPPFATDIDGDMDNDILFLEGWNLELKIYINSNGEGNFIQSAPITSITGFYPSDIDGDGDVDIICSINYPVKSLIWYENSDGLGNFSISHVIDNIDFTYTPWIYSNDLDGDGDLDILAASTPPNSRKIVWYENLSPPISIDENVLTKLSVYPNPTSSIVNIQSKANIVQIDVTNSLGQLVLTNTNKSSIDIATLGQGLYYLKIIDENGNLYIEKVLKE